MSFDELIEVLRSFQGKNVDVSINLPSLDGEPFGVASFSGVVDEVNEGGAPAGVQRLWFAHDNPPSPNVVSFDPSAFTGAEFTADREEADQSKVDEVGMTWTLTVRQMGIEVEVLVYV